MSKRQDYDYLIKLLLIGDSGGRGGQGPCRPPGASRAVGAVESVATEDWRGLRGGGAPS